MARVLAVQALVGAGHTVAAAAAEITGPVGSGAVRYSSLAAVYAATRAVLASEHPEEVIAAINAFVRTVGARPVAASEDPANAIPLDIALGEGPPVLAVADPSSAARLELERLLPPLVDDARTVLARVHLDNRRRRRRRTNG